MDVHKNQSKYLEEVSKGKLPVFEELSKYNKDTDCSNKKSNNLKILLFLSFLENNL